MWWEPTFSLSVSPPFLCPLVDLAWYPPGWLECWDNDDWPRGTTARKHSDWSCAIRIVFYFNEYISQYCAFLKKKKNRICLFMSSWNNIANLLIAFVVAVAFFYPVSCKKLFQHQNSREYTCKFKILYNLRSSNETLDIIT